MNLNKILDRTVKALIIIGVLWFIAVCNERAYIRSIIDRKEKQRRDSIANSGYPIGPVLVPKNKTR